MDNNKKIIPAFLLKTYEILEVNLMLIFGGILFKE